MKVQVHGMESDKLELSEDFRETNLFKAIRGKDASSMLQCTKNGDDVNFRCQKTANSYLHILMIEASPITETKYVPMLYQLSNANANLDVVDKNDVSPLTLSIKCHLLELMIGLIKCGATCHPDDDLELIASRSGPVECEFRSAYRKFSPGFWLPVEEDKAFKVNVLVKSWCRINISKNGKTLIEFAKEKNAQEKIVKMLIDNEVSVEFAHATIAGDAEKMDQLLQHFTVNTETKDFSHKESYFEPYFPLTLYGAAIKYGHRHILYLLKKTTDAKIKHSADNNDDAPTTPLTPSSSSVCSIV